MKESKMLLVIAALVTAAFGVAALATPDVHAQKSAKTKPAVERSHAR